MSWSWRSVLTPQGGYRALLTERLRLLRLVRHGGGGAAGLVVVDAVVSVGPAATSLVTGFAVGRMAGVLDGSAPDPVSAVVGAVLAVGVVLLITQLAEAASEGLAVDVRLRIDGWVRARVRAAAAAQPTLLDLGRPSFAEDALRASDLGQHGGRVSSIGNAVVGQTRLTLRLSGGVVAAAVLAQFSLPLAVIVSLLALLNRAILRRQWIHLAGVGEERIGLGRRSSYWSMLGSNLRSAGEVRLFGLGGWIASRRLRVTVAQRGPGIRERMAVMRQQVVIITLTAVTAFVGIAFPAVAATRGELDAAQLVTALTAVFAILGSLAPMGHEAFDIEYGRGTLRAFDRLLGTIPPRLSGASGSALTARSGGPVGASPGPLTDPPSGAPLIRLTGVRFGYLGDRPAVLDGLDLSIGRGEVLGLVGNNGAGKTTLVTLMAGLIRPTAGRIDSDAAGAAAVFQDLLHYPLSLRDNVTLAAPEAPADDEAVLAALRQAGAGSLPDRLPAGLDTVLRRDLAHGADLSGGQWQRVAIARAVFAARAGRELIILDEPTANLDVRAETAFYRRVVGLLRGKTIVLISHRLSTVRRADRIVLLADGRIAEQGSHDELMTQDGSYAHLFRLQSARFADPPSPPGGVA